MLQPRGQRRAIELDRVGLLDQRLRSRSAASGELPSAAARCGSSRPVSRRHSSTRAEASREAAIVLIAGRAGLLGHHAAGADREQATVRHRQQLLELHRAIGVLADVVWLGAEDGRVILAAAEGAHAAIALEPAEALPVLDRAQITGQVGLAADVMPIFVAGGQVVDFREHQKHAHHQALELLMPAAGGKSLASAMSAPRQAPGKLRATRRATVIG